MRIGNPSCVFGFESNEFGNRVASKSEAPAPGSGWHDEGPGGQEFGDEGATDTKNWSFSAYVQNLGEEDYFTGTGENFGVSGMRLRSTPRIIGGHIKYIF